ncbi:MAG: trigger factor [Microgenomates group bacterium]
MYSYKINKLPKKTVEVIVKIAAGDIKREEDIAFEKLLQNLEVAGFRKGKVPKDVAKKNISRQAIYEQIIKKLLPQLYEEIIKKENLKPIISPKIELIKAKEGEDWEIKFTIALKPDFILPDYKNLIKKLKNEQKKTDIWLPGKNQPSSSNDDKEEGKQKLLNNILEKLLLETKIEIPDLLIEEELNRRLTNLLDDIRKIGLTVEGYLKSKNTTIEQLKQNISKEIEDTYKLEFILGEIADLENIQVDKEDLNKLFANITDNNQRQEAEKNSYFYAAILRKQKTFDFLLNL